MLQARAVTGLHTRHIASEPVGEFLGLCPVLKWPFFSLHPDTESDMILFVVCAPSPSRFGEASGNRHGDGRQEIGPFELLPVLDEEGRYCVMGNMAWDGFTEKIARHRHASDAFELELRDPGVIRELVVGDWLIARNVLEDVEFHKPAQTRQVLILQAWSEEQDVVNANPLDSHG